ncbi:dipicolinate synthase subunit B [Anoxybacter fermentans]|uniref:Dipicolinate synthase subunit B n=1 Tax=Anoxybacter fermentans TaxID=1323375 RepID=A0A3Q9HPD9_9FIRM|nr:dipicolinate synthase subunit B [Anoxybacter fermentans]AZR72416.1 dipicolinate synthase subunit B [Anoxybacter fermentans]
MDLKGKKIGFCLTGSFCTFDKVIPQIERLVEMGADIVPIMSHNAYSWDTKFGPAEKWRKMIEEITGKKILHTIVEVEPIGPGKIPLDVVVVAPATGNTLAALANGLTNGPVPMACKAHWRNGKPVVIAISTNDGLGASAKNIGILHDKALTFMVPYGQDNPHKKEKSLVAHFEYIPDTIKAALEGKQFQPVLIPHAF